MNILFLLRTLGTGGVTVVSSVLANKFTAEGHRVFAFYFDEGSSSVADRFDNRVKLLRGHGYKISKENIALLRKILVEYSIEIIINQWGLPLTPIRTALKASTGLNVKIVSVYHNAPCSNGRLQQIDTKLMDCENLFKRGLLKIKKVVYKNVTSRAMKYIYDKSDMFLVLSESYRGEFSRFTGVKALGKLNVMTNPITINAAGFEYSADSKRKEIIYVGRLDIVQKRVYRIIDTWNYLEDKYPDWKLTIVGDGEDRSNLELHAKAMGLRHVSFEGFKQPLEYYKRASVLILTSDFEGFPLVLAECMRFGVVPVVYHSFAAVEDIIEHGKDGVILPFNPDGYKANEMSIEVSRLMEDEGMRQQMALAAIEKSRNYSLDVIYERWITLLEQMTKNNH